MITNGLLWYDDDPSRPPEETIRRAANRYETKYGKKPNRCYVNRGTPGLVHVQQSAQALGIEVESAKFVLPYHFWLGIAEPPKTIHAAVLVAIPPIVGGS